MFILGESGLTSTMSIINSSMLIIFLILLFNLFKQFFDFVSILLKASILILFLSFNLKSITMDGFILLSDPVNNISETVLQCKSLYCPWLNVPNDSYTVSSTATNTLLEVNGMNNYSKLALRLLIMDTNVKFTKISISSLDLSELPFLLLFLTNCYNLVCLFFLLFMLSVLAFIRRVITRAHLHTLVGYSRNTNSFIINNSSNVIWFLFTLFVNTSY